MKFFAPCLTCALLFAQADVQAASIYRCGVKGREFSQMPCPDGTRLDIKDRRTNAQQTEAKQLASAQMRQADMLEKERLRREARFLDQKAGSLGPDIGAGQTRLHVASVGANEQQKHVQRNHARTGKADFKALAPKPSLEKKKKGKAVFVIEDAR